MIPPKLRQLFLFYYYFLSYNYYCFGATEKHEKLFERKMEYRSLSRDQGITLASVKVIPGRNLIDAECSQILLVSFSSYMYINFVRCQQN